MNLINKIEFVHHETSNIRRHYVTKEDIEIVLSRLPSELWNRLKKIHFKDDSRGGHTLGYTTTRGRREITLCALPHRLSLNRAFKPKPIAKEFGALANSQWPSLAIRRFMLYDVLLHEIGHLQIILPKNANPKRKFAHETLAQSFADKWRRQLWSTTYDHPDPVHNAPNKTELKMLEEGWIKAHLAYKQGISFEQAGKKEQAILSHQQAIDLYPHHALAFEHLGILLYANDDTDDALERVVDLLRQAIALDPMLWNANMYLALALDRLNQFDESRQTFERLIALEPYKNIAVAFYADALSNRGYQKEAEKLFQRVLKKEPILLPKSKGKEGKV
jgi:tetratricopeptide (TPR) repeat protein